MKQQRHCLWYKKKSAQEFKRQCYIFTWLTLSGVCCKILVPPNKTWFLSRLADNFSSIPLPVIETWEKFSSVFTSSRESDSNNFQIYKPAANERITNKQTRPLFFPFVWDEHKKAFRPRMKTKYYSIEEINLARKHLGFILEHW